jgi:hypothetical protein
MFLAFSCLRRRARRFSRCRLSFKTSGYDKVLFAVRDEFGATIECLNRRVADVRPNAVGIAVFVKLNLNECM